jgi:hypothetical protein
MKASTLEVGSTYFRLTFADRDLTMPGVEPVVYLGEVADVGGTQGFAFQDPASYVKHGSGLEGEEQHEDIVLYFLPESEIGALYSVEELAVEVAESAQRAVSQNHPKLKPVRHTQ